jgi:hypothetical protein
MTAMPCLTSHDFFTRFRNGENGYEQRDSDGTEADASGRAHSKNANGHRGNFGQMAGAGKPCGDALGAIPEAVEDRRGDRQYDPEIHNRRRRYDGRGSTPLAARKARALDHSANAVYWSGFAFLVGSAAAVAVGLITKILGV